MLEIEGIFFVFVRAKHGFTRHFKPHSTGASELHEFKIQKIKRHVAVNLTSMTSQNSVFVKQNSVYSRMFVIIGDADVLIFISTVNPLSSLHPAMW